MEKCSICNKIFYDGYYHSVEWKLFCHLSSKGKAHRRLKYNISFPDIYYKISIKDSKFLIIE